MILHHLTRDPPPFEVKPITVTVPPPEAGGQIVNKPDGVLWCWPPFGEGQKWDEWIKDSRGAEPDLITDTRLVVLEVDPEGMLVIDTLKQAKRLPWRKFPAGPGSALAVYGLDWIQLAGEFSGCWLTEQGLRETQWEHFPGMIDIEGDPDFEMVLPVTFDHWSVESIAIFDPQAVKRVIQEHPFGEPKKLPRPKRPIALD
jgi:hypothetical protein